MAIVERQLLVRHFDDSRVQSVADLLLELDEVAQEDLRTLFQLAADKDVRLNSASPAFQSATGLLSLAAAFRREGRMLIVDGKPAVAEEIGGCVATGGESKFWSSGCLIAPKVVLTSRHFSRGVTRVSSAGEVVADSPSARVRLRRPPGPGELPHSYFHDVALLFLHEEISGLSPAQLLEVPLYKGIVTGRPVGYGATDTRDISGYGKRLIAGSLTIYHDDTPKDPDFDPKTQFLADDRGNATDACVGDSGGPFLVEHDGRQKVAGISLRRSTPNAACGEGTIYLRVHPFLEWIRRTIKSNGGPLVDVQPAA